MSFRARTLLALACWSPVSMACLPPIPPELLPPPQPRPPPPEYLPPAVLTPAQQADALAMIPPSLRSDIDTITPALGHRSSTSAESPPVACGLSRYGCDVIGTSVHFKAVPVASGVCARTRVWMSFDNLDFLARYKHLPVDQWLKATGKTQLRADGRPCDEWPLDAEGARTSAYASVQTAANILSWLYTQQGLIRAGLPSVLRVTCWSGARTCPFDPLTMFAAVRLEDIPVITPQVHEQGRRRPDPLEQWKFSFKAVAVAVPQSFWIKWWPATLHLPPQGDPVLQFRHPSIPCNAPLSLP